MASVSLIIPAHDESATLERGLRNVLTQACDDLDIEVIVVANGCTDDTVAIAEGLVGEFSAAGIDLQVHDDPVAGKTAALNFGDQCARGDVLFYCDADITMAPGTLRAMTSALQDPDIDLVSASQDYAMPQNRIVRGWANCYHASPYQRGDDVVHGLFGVTRAGRSRFGSFPETMADDRYLSLIFGRHERQRVDDAVIQIHYTESPAELIDQQARWTANNADIDRRFPELLADNAPAHNANRWPYFERPLPTVIDMACYGLVTVSARLRVLMRRSQILSRWDRARPA